MPASARTSSLGGARRGAQKAHIPYRGDNPEVGKKTGIVVRHVERMSDGFEPFEDVLEQADGRTPPNMKVRKKRLVAPRVSVLDEDGEMSMDLDATPVRYFAEARPPSTPTPLSRASAYSRPVARTLDVDFDQIPSPRPRTSSHRSTGHFGPGPSNLRSSMSARDAMREPLSDQEPAYYEQAATENHVFDEYAPQEIADAEDAIHSMSFTQIDDGADEHEDDHRSGDVFAQHSPARREVTEEDDRREPFSQKNHTRPSKKAKITQEKAQARLETSSKKENRIQREGVRRSGRDHYAPLEWWRGEKYVYGRTNTSGPCLVPPIREILRIPKDMPMPLAHRRKRVGSVARGKSKATSEVPVDLDLNPEEGWDDDTSPDCLVLDFDTRRAVEKRIAYTAKMVDPKKAANSDWFFDKIFHDADFIAAGQLIIPPKCRKPSKATKDNTYIFYVIHGAVNLKVHDTSVILGTGGMFMVPRGNTYFIENISNRDAKLFFTQARKIPQSENPRRSAGTPIAYVKQKSNDRELLSRG